MESKYIHHSKVSRGKPVKIAVWAAKWRRNLSQIIGLPRKKREGGAPDAASSLYRPETA
ncbi:protein of unknown function [Kyrpidia spormannii]|uniref:Uncharacterized protein n=1 Tax=Kyrpidia spormannii TaxID=2055160 RepID=A0ACA8Z7B8_9BACL|nr:protein of unknown function [Kyrpidia spormannii]